MNAVTEKLMQLVTGVKGTFAGAYNIREDGGCAGRRSTDTIRIEPLADGKSGLQITVLPHTKGERVYIPAFVTKSSVTDLTYNDFVIGEGAEVTIVAGCGVHVDGDQGSEHNGIHRFFVGPGATVTYEEKHIGLGEGTGKRRIDPVTEAFLDEGATLIMDTVQMGGVESTIRKTKATLQKDAKVIVREKLLTDGDDVAETDFHVVLEGDGAGCDLVSRSVAKGRSKQHFISHIEGRAACHGHSACDAILADDAVVTATPRLDAYNPDAALIHEAAIGKIAGEQILKLRTLGLTEEEAEEKIIQGFLK